ncbi:MAG: GTPase HflX, partial [Lysobacteraceae bacterium]
MFERSKRGERALLIQPHSGSGDDPAVLEEFAELARSAGATVAATLPARIDRINPATLIGSGKVEEAQSLCSAADIDLVLVNHALSPV